MENLKNGWSRFLVVRNVIPTIETTGLRNNINFIILAPLWEVPWHSGGHPATTRDYCRGVRQGLGGLLLHEHCK